MNIAALQQQSAQWVVPVQGRDTPAQADSRADTAADSTQSDLNKQSGSPSDKPQSTQSSKDSSVLTQEQLDMITQLKARDTEVRAHEAAHLAAAGSYATSGASYSYQKGPDGRAYAIGGEVGIDASAIPNDPEATMRKADVVIRAAMAPAEPSSQDYKVAQSAQQMRMQAAAELAQQTSKQATGEQREENPMQQAKGLSQVAATDESQQNTLNDQASSLISNQAKARYQSAMTGFLPSGFNSLGFATQA